MSNSNQKINILTQRELEQTLRNYNLASSVAKRAKSRVDVENMGLEGAFPAFIKQQKRADDILLKNYGSRLFAYEKGLTKFNEEMAETFFGRYFPKIYGEFEIHDFSKAILTKTKEGIIIALRSEISPKQDPIEAMENYLKLGIVGLVNAKPVKSDSPNHVEYKGTPVRRRI